MSESVRIYEVGPRDGLQNEQAVLDTAVKIELIDRLSESGLTHIEAGSFVSPRWVPQMANTPEIMARIGRRKGVTYPVLVPNQRGMEEAIKAAVTEVAVFASASESFSLKNINCNIAESLERFVSVIETAKAHNIRVRGYVSCVAGCPYEGAVSPSAAAAVSDKLYRMGCYEISLGDTIGTGTPRQIQEIVRVAAGSVPLASLALHCHDTYGQALANIYAGMEEGIRIVDSSVAGLGGCPYAKGASGNVATEDVLYMLNGLGLATGVSLDKILESAWFISERLGRKPASKVANAFPRA
jgi:hydroxymethylglutaryl-CoA lyase